VQQFEDILVESDLDAFIPTGNFPFVPDANRAAVELRTRSPTRARASLPIRSVQID
jgi:hypothetical protein